MTYPQNLNPLQPAKKQSFASTSWIVWSLVLGVLVGLFFGEPAAKLQVLGDIYIGLLQMTVLPYILFALIANIGLLNYVEARLLAKYGVLVLLVLWLIGALSVWAIAIALPPLEAGQFFSSLQVKVPTQLQFLDLFIPSNPFLALSQNAVPAVVLFSMLFGVACIGYTERKSLLQHCDQAAKVLLRVNGFIVKLSPIGVFGIAASAAGTLTLEEFGRVQAYVLMLGVTVVLVVLLVLPLVIMSCTPFSYKQIFRASRDALLTVFVVGSIFVVIPLLTQGVSRLFHAHVTAGHEHARIPDLVLPLAYPFPDIGRLLSLVFIVFAAWFYGQPLDFFEYPEMLFIGLFLSFGKLITAIPFLLDLFRIPDDIFNLFLTVGILCRRFADVAGAMHLFTFTILTTAIMTDVFHIRWRKLLWSVLVSVLAFGVSILLLQSYLASHEDKQHGKEHEILQMQLLKSGVQAQMLSYSFANPVPLKVGQGLLQRIYQRRVLRVGVMEDNLPFSYYNTQGNLVGFDVELMHRLADDLGVKLEFVPYESEYLLQELEEDHFDLAVSGITANLRLLAASRIMYSHSYLDTHFAFVVPDHRRLEFSTREAIQAIRKLRVNVRKDSAFIERIKHHFPHADINELDAESEFFNMHRTEHEVLVSSAEGGSAWTLLYPSYRVVDPLANQEGLPLVIAIARQDLLMEKFLSTWINLKRQDGTIQDLFAHWIEGETTLNKARRWSVWQDVILQEKGWAEKFVGF